MKIKKIRPTAKMPTFGTKGAACFDLYVSEDTILYFGKPTKVPTALAFEVPEGHCMTVYSRSSSALKGINIVPLIVDSDYRGEVFILANYIRPLEYGYEKYYVVKAGDRIAQARLEKLEPTSFEWAEELSETKRGTGGYGSTGR